MSILTGNEIEKQIDLGNIEISPFERDHVGPNSVDLRLADELLIYQLPSCGYLDTRQDPQTINVDKHSDGSYLLLPNTLYLGRTIETLHSNIYVPIVEGRSSVGRLGIQVHMTAGVGDIGFKGTITLEICTVHPVKIYPNQRICQVLWLETNGMRSLYKGRYQGQVQPTASRMFMPGYLPRPKILKS